jgi:hypothetical protein
VNICTPLLSLIIPLTSTLPDLLPNYSASLLLSASLAKMLSGALIGVAFDLQHTKPFPAMDWQMFARERLLILSRADEFEEQLLRHGEM